MEESWVLWATILLWLPHPLKPMLMMEKNYKVQCSVQGKEVPEDFSIREEVDKVLDSIQFREKRARIMDIDDFMKLLHAFNAAGIHFA